MDWRIAPEWTDRSRGGGGGFDERRVRQGCGGPKLERLPGASEVVEDDRGDNAFQQRSCSPKGGGGVGETFSHVCMLVVSGAATQGRNFFACASQKKKKRGKSSRTRPKKKKRGKSGVEKVRGNVVFTGRSRPGRGAT